MSFPTTEDVLDQLHADLHELCQPLTALQCRLEIGQMMVDARALREAVDGGLEETRRMFEVIDRMRHRLICEEAIVK